MKVDMFEMFPNRGAGWLGGQGIKLQCMPPLSLWDPNDSLHISKKTLRREPIAQGHDTIINRWKDRALSIGMLLSRCGVCSSSYLFSYFHLSILLCCHKAPIRFRFDYRHLLAFLVCAPLPTSICLVSCVPLLHMFVLAFQGWGCSGILALNILLKAQNGAHQS